MSSLQPAKLSMVIPCYTLTKQLEEMTLFGIASYREQVDELIIVEDGGMYSPSFQTLADTYIYCKDNLGFTANVNRGWRYSTGDFTCIASSDTQLMAGSLRDLMIPGRVTSPEIVNQNIQRLAGPFFCVPKEIRDVRGYLMEEMVIYSSDSEYDARVADIFTKVPSVRVFHEQMQTVKAAGVEGSIQQDIDHLQYARLIEEGRAK